MKTKIIVLAVLAVAAGAFAYSRLHKAVPLAGSNAAHTDLPYVGKSVDNIPEQKSAPAEDIPKGNVATNMSAQPVEFIAIPGGKFTMGTGTNEKGFKDAKPPHEVVIKTFDLAKTAVTVEQYAECVMKGGCKEPAAGDSCNWGLADRQLHPVNCVSWAQANQYAKFMGARLPTEAEFEYAAAGGRKQKYPWGNEEATCGKAVMSDSKGVFGCGTNATMPVCSKPAGNTAQGLCDMAGNVFQWVQDKYRDTYIGAPADGRAVEGAGPLRVMRGGSFNCVDALPLRTGFRGRVDPGYRDAGIGFRLAKSR